MVSENGDSNRNGHVLVQQMELDNENPSPQSKSKVYLSSVQCVWSVGETCTTFN